MSEQNQVLVSTIGDHQVTMTNPGVGTVQISTRGYWAFHRIVIDRGELDAQTNQSEVLCELGDSFRSGTWLRNRDRDGNMMVLDILGEIMFIIDPHNRMLLCAFDQRKRRETRQAAQASRRAA